MSYGEYNYFASAAYQKKRQENIEKEKARVAAQTPVERALEKANDIIREHRDFLDSDIRGIKALAEKGCDDRFSEGGKMMNRLYAQKNPSASRRAVRRWVDAYMAQNPALFSVVGSAMDLGTPNKGLEPAQAFSSYLKYTARLLVKGKQQVSHSPEGLKLIGAKLRSRDSVAQSKIKFIKYTDPATGCRFSRDGVAWIKFKERYYPVVPSNCRVKYPGDVGLTLLREKMVTKINTKRVAQLNRQIRAIYQEHADASWAREQLKKTRPSSKKDRSFSPKLRAQIFKRDDYKCVVCGQGLEDGTTLEADHIVPYSEGGKTELSNGRTLCRECNVGEYHVNQKSRKTA